MTWGLPDVNNQLEEYGSIFFENECLYLSNLKISCLKKVLLLFLLSRKIEWYNYYINACKFLVIC